MEQKFYVCEHCGKIAAIVKESGVPLMCCGEKMKELVPGTTEAAAEKHIPVCIAKNNQVTVTVGEVSHPMLPEHYIEWISLETKQGNQRKICWIRQKKAGFGIFFLFKVSTKRVNWCYNESKF